MIKNVKLRHERRLRPHDRRISRIRRQNSKSELVVAIQLLQKEAAEVSAVLTDKGLKAVQGTQHHPRRNGVGAGRIDQSAAEV